MSKGRYFICVSFTVPCVAEETVDGEIPEKVLDLEAEIYDKVLAHFKTDNGLSTEIEYDGPAED